MKDIKYYEDLGKFNGFQLIEIDKGLENGVDVSIYAKPEFESEQMRQIRKGLENEIDVSAYATPEFDWRQMNDIYKKLSNQKENEILNNSEKDFER